ncbi:hypothetical protein B7494_g6411 [Chlorociboria aeruginascens]|nr:hypothetical protein B7494_g6411 [Chlorociboria aeruginascens]
MIESEWPSSPLRTILLESLPRSYPFIQAPQASVINEPLEVEDLKASLASGKGQFESTSVKEGYRRYSNIVSDTNWNDVLMYLPPAVAAPFDSYDRQHEPACLPGTRVDLLQEIYDWAYGKNEQDERCIFWQRPSWDWKGDENISHASKLLTSLAAYLAIHIPSLRKYIYEAVEKQNDIASLSLSEQWHQLVISLLSNLQSESYRSYIIVIDTLDKWENDKDVRIIWQLLAEAQPLTTARLRVSLTSKPEISIRYGIHDISQVEYQDFQLQNIPLAIVDHDISLFLKSNLGEVRQRWNLEADWPGEEVLR